MKQRHSVAPRSTKLSAVLRTDQYVHRRKLKRAELMRSDSVSPGLYFGRMLWLQYLDVPIDVLMRKRREWFTRSSQRERSLSLYL